MGTLAKVTNDFFPSFFDDLFTGDFLNRPLSRMGSVSRNVPAVNVKETVDNYMIEVAAPGLNRKDFKVEVDNDLLTISGEHQETREADEDYAMREFNYQSFSRSFHIPHGMVNGDNIEANYKDGILQVALPKTKEAKSKTKRTIKIS